MLRVAVGMLALGAALLGQAAPAAAQDANATAPEDDLTEIEVLSQREMARQVFKDELRQMTQRLSVFESMPRFFQPLCVDVAGLAADQARFVADRIVATSLDLGLGKPRDGCRTNAMVIVVDDPERMYKTLVRKRLDLVGVLPFRDVHTRRIEDQVRSKAPVVWWSVISTANAQGVTDDDMGLVILRNIALSRTTSASYRPKNLSVVMYDARQLAGASLGQIADHAALHILGMPRRQADLGGLNLPSMLRLFEGSPAMAPEELTDFDRAYLQGLYGLGHDALQSQVPRAVVAAYAERCEAEGSDCRIPVRN